MGLPQHEHEPTTSTPSPLLGRCRSMTARPTEMPRAFKNERSVSCPVRGTVAGERFVRTSSGVAFESEAFRLQTEARIAQLLDEASSPVSSSTNVLLAQKTLKYWRVDVSAVLESTFDRFR